MRIAIMAVAALGALSLAACQNKAEKAADATADAVKADANVAATQVENQADATKAAGENSADAMKTVEKPLPTGGMWVFPAASVSAVEIPIAQEDV